MLCSLCILNPRGHIGNRPRGYWTPTSLAIIRHHWAVKRALCGKKYHAEASPTGVTNAGRPSKGPPARFVAGSTCQKNQHQTHSARDDLEAGSQPLVGQTGRRIPARPACAKTERAVEAAEECGSSGSFSSSQSVVGRHRPFPLPGWMYVLPPKKSIG